MTVTVFTKNACMQCVATFRQLDKKGIRYNKVNIEETPEALDQVASLGYRQMPVVLANAGSENEQHWAGFNPGRIAGLIA